jgi:hypothetical protein
LQSILLISHCATSANISQSLQLIIASHQSSFSNRSSHLFLALLLPHLMITLLPTILLHFWLFFSSFFHTLRLQFLHSFLSLLTLLLLIILHLSITIPPTVSLPFYSLSPHLIFYLTLPLLFFQLFPSLLGSASPHYSTPYYYNSSNSSSLFFIILLLIFFFFFYKFHITFSTPLFFIQSILYLQKKVTTLLLCCNRFFFFFFHCFLQLFSWFISFCVFDNFTLKLMCFGILVLYSIILITCFFFHSYGFA